MKQEIQMCPELLNQKKIYKNNNNNNNKNNNNNDNKHDHEHQKYSTNRDNNINYNDNKKIMKTRNHEANMFSTSQRTCQLSPSIMITSLSTNGSNDNICYDNNNNVSSNNINRYLKQQPYTIPIYLLPRIIDRALPSILQDFLGKILHSFFQQKSQTLPLIFSSAVDSSTIIFYLLMLLPIDKILSNFMEIIGHNYLSKLMIILFSRFLIKNSRVTPKHRWLCTKNGILKTNSNQVSTLSVRFNNNPPKLHLFNKSSQEQVPVLQVAGPSKGRYSREELEEHREFMLTKINIAMRKKKWKSVKRLIEAAFKTYTNC